MYKKDLAISNLQWLICHKTKPNLHGVIVPVRSYVLNRTIKPFNCVQTND